MINLFRMLWALRLKRFYQCIFASRGTNIKSKLQYTLFLLSENLTISFIVELQIYFATQASCSLILINLCLTVHNRVDSLLVTLIFILVYYQNFGPYCRFHMFIFGVNFGQILLSGVLFFLLHLIKSKETYFLISPKTILCLVHIIKGLIILLDKIVIDQIFIVCLANVLLNLYS